MPAFIRLQWKQKPRIRAAGHLRHQRMPRPVLWLAVFALVLPARAEFKIAPTTTLAAETANNTAVRGHRAEANGNAPPANISKIPVRSLLPSTFQGKILAHYMPWWGKPSGHIDIGYSEHDPEVIRRQVEDMISRGFDGVIVAEWNSNDWNFRTTELLFEEVVRHPGFLFAVMQNHASFDHAADRTAKLVADMQYASRRYFGSPNYLRKDGRPVVFFFDSDLAGLDWKEAKRRLAGNPIFVFRNPGGFQWPASDGAFAWIDTGPDSGPAGLNYLRKFYSAARESRAYALGSAWKGFDDSLAHWRKGRYVPQRCGLTWLDSMAAASDSAARLDGVQVATWNDYEEGTAVEPGMDNCGMIAASISGDTLRFEPRFTAGGNESTVDHYTVFISQDGETLMPLVILDRGSRSLDLTRFELRPGVYYFFVQMVGRPMIRNQMSARLTYQVGAASEAP